jgi:hypothetical protein
MPFEDTTFASATEHAFILSDGKGVDAQRPNMHQRLAPKQSLKNQKAAGQTHRVQTHTYLSELSTHHNSGALCFVAAHLQLLKRCQLNNLKRQMPMRKQLSLKTIYLALTILVLAAGSVSAQSPSMRGPLFKIKVYSGASILPYFTSGLRDVHITSFPGGFFGRAEERLAVPLSQGTSESIRFGGLLGLEVSNLGGYKRLSFNLEVQGMPGENSRYFNVAAGFGYKFFDLKEDAKQDFPLTIGLLVKGGYAFGVSTFAQVEALADRPFTSTVVTDGGLFQVGDRVQADILGATLQAAVTVNAEIVKNVDVGLQLGYSGAWLSTVTLTSGSGGTLNPLSPHVVNPNTTDRTQGFARAFTEAPSISLNGFFAALQFGLTVF